MSAACTQFEEDVTPTYDSEAKPEVAATVVSDTEITVTVTAGAGTNFWGYAVMTGAPGATADKLVADGYAKDAAVVVYEGTAIDAVTTFGLNIMQVPADVEITVTDVVAE